MSLDGGVGGIGYLFLRGGGPNVVGNIKRGEGGMGCCDGSCFQGEVRSRQGWSPILSRQARAKGALGW